MTAKITLDLPDKMPRWATDIGRTLEPDETGTILSNKDLGWLLGDEPPARWMNWLLNRTFQWIQRLGGIVVSNWTNQAIGIGGDVDTAVYHPVLGYYFIYSVGGASGRYSNNGFVWNTPTLTGLTPTAKSTTIDTVNIIIANTNSDLKYSPDLTGAWSTDTGPTAMTTIQRLDTKYPDSDYIAACDTLGAVKYASGGIGTSWLDAAISAYTGSASCVGFMYLGDSIWFILPDGGDTKISTDDCANFSSTSTAVSTIIDGTSKALGYNQDSGTLVAIGENAGGTANKIARSTDNGATWTESTFDNYDTATSTFNPFNDIYYCGGDIWLIVGNQSSDQHQGMLVSYDDGITFKPTKTNDLTSNPNFEFEVIACSGSNFIVGVQTGEIYTSLSIPGTQKP